MFDQNDNYLLSLRCVFFCKSAKRTAKSNFEKDLSIISCLLHAVQLSYIAYVCNAMNSFKRRNWKKRNPCIAKCDSLYYCTAPVNEIEQKN